MKFKKATQTKPKRKCLTCSIIFGISFVGVLLALVTILKSKSCQEDDNLVPLRVQISTSTTTRLTMTTAQATTDEIFLGCYNSSIGNVQLIYSIGIGKIEPLSIFRECIACCCA